MKANRGIIPTYPYVILAILIVVTISFACNSGEPLLTETPISTEEVESSLDKPEPSAASQETEQEPIPPEPTAAPTQTKSPPPEIISAPTNPIDISVELDASMFVTATIPITGGNLNMVGFDGIQYNLEIPEGALLSTETITLTVITNVEGLPLRDGLSAGIHAEPNGLMFFKPVTLTLVLPEDKPIDDIVGFAYHGSGQSFHLYPWQRDGRTITIQVMHLSGFGIGRGSKDDVASMQNHLTCSTAERINQSIAVILHDVETSMVEDTEGDFSPQDWADIEELLQLWYDWVVEPELDAAMTDDNRVMCGIYHALEWLEAIMIFGLDEEGDPFEGKFQELTQTFTEILKNAIYMASQRCEEENDPNQAMRIMRLSELLLVFGLPSEILNLETEVWPMVVDCVRFELEFDSYTVDSFYGSSAHLYVDGLSIALDNVVHHDWRNEGDFVYDEGPSLFGDFTLRGSKPITWLHYANLDTCFKRWYEITPNLDVVRLEINLNPGPDENCECETSQQPISDIKHNNNITMQYFFSDWPRQAGETICRDQGGAEESDLTWWSPFTANHLYEGIAKLRGLYLAENWEMAPEGNPLFATYHFEGSNIGGTEVTTVKLWHKAKPPEAPPPIDHSPASGTGQVIDNVLPRSDCFDLDSGSVGTGNSCDLSYYLEQSNPVPMLSSENFAKIVSIPVGTPQPSQEDCRSALIKSVSPSLPGFGGQYFCFKSNEDAYGIFVLTDISDPSSEIGISSMIFP